MMLRLLRTTLLVMAVQPAGWSHAAPLERGADRGALTVAQVQQGGIVTAAPRSAAEALARDYRLTSADGTRRCVLTLGTGPAGPGLSLTFDRAACAEIAFAAAVAAWAPDAAGSIRLLDSKGQLVAEFTEAAEGSFEALREGDGVYFLEPPAASPAPVEEAAVVGDWLLLREAGTPVCRWTLTDAPAPDGGKRVEVAAGCDPFLTQFAPTSWVMSGGNILVKGAADGTTIRFALQDDGIWARIPERSRPLHMTRP